MQKLKIPFQKIGSIPPLIKDFLNNEIPQFRNCRFTLEHITQVVKEKSA